MEPKMPQIGPYAVSVDAGKEYHWCACGGSKNQPFCDGSHKGTGFTPVLFNVPETASFRLCGCKHSKNAPFCDGTHKTL